MNNEHITELLKKVHEGSATADEWDELLSHIKNDENFSVTFQIDAIVRSKITMKAGTEGTDEWKRMAEQVLRADNVPVIRMRQRMRSLWWAAAVLVLAATGTWLAVKNNPESQPVQVVERSIEVISPGSDGAILTLADGRSMVLDSLGNGMIAEQQGTKVILNNGQLAYDLSGQNNGTIVYNTLSTPKGRQFFVKLPDGTKVWLNAASSIRYPTMFAGKERKVEVTGEACFEVAKNAKMPFHAIVNNIADIEVLGTYFNVNAYENETSVNTTLLEGIVRVNGTTIKPGQQAQIAIGQATASQRVRVINDVHTEQVMAWKNGFINFEGATFDAIMRQLERWYDIQVVYDKNIIPTTRLAGKMTRGVPLDGLLKNLEALGVHFKLDGRKLIILQ